MPPCPDGPQKPARDKRVCVDGAADGLEGANLAGPPARLPVMRARV